MVQANVQWGIIGPPRKYMMYNHLGCSNGHLLGARSASGSSMKVVAAVIAAIVVVVASIASGSHVVGDLKVAIRATARVSSRGSRGTWHRQSDGESRVLQRARQGASWWRGTLPPVLILAVCLKTIYES
jgi:hypothetical protein